MLAKNKKIISIVILIIVVFSLFFALTEIQKANEIKEFNEGYSELQAIWKTKDIDMKEFDYKGTKINHLPYNELDELKTKFIGFQAKNPESKTGKALKELANIYVMLIELGKTTEKLYYLYEDASIIPTEQYCDYTLLFKDIDELNANKLQIITKLKTQTEKFQITYPEFNKIVKLDSTKFALQELIQQTQKQQQTTQELKKACGVE